MNIEDKLLLSTAQRKYAPQNYVPLGNGLNVPDDFIISRDVQGNPMSLYKHDVWRMGTYSAYNTSFNFTTWHKGNQCDLFVAIVEEMKSIQFSRLYLYPNARKVQSVRFHPLRTIAGMAFSMKVTITKFLSSPEFEIQILRFISTLQKKAAASDVVRLLHEIHVISKSSPNSGLSISETLPERATAMEASTFGHTQRTEQTWLIPSRIYAAIITEFSTALDGYNEISKEIIELYHQRAKQPNYGHAASSMIRNKDIPDWETATVGLGVHKQLSDMGINSVKKLNAYLNEIVATAKYFIHIFSGMRDGEVTKLPSNALQGININGKLIPVILGFTYKGVVESLMPTTWITSSIVNKGFDAALSIGRIAQIINNYSLEEAAEYPLFPMVSHSKTHTQPMHYRIPLRASFKIPNAMRKNPIFNITEEDIRELEIFDGFTDWRNIPSLKIGKSWPLKTHQCRRSLAVYGARSGSISLGSMSSQFKHLTDMMTSYYRSGSTFAVNFIDDTDQKAFIGQLEANRKLSQYEAYVSNVIQSTSSLWGGEGNRIKFASDRGAPLIIVTDRALTKEYFEKGKLVYKSGPLGGCTNPNPCELIKFTNLTPCTHCSFAILDENSIPKINRAIKTYIKGNAQLSKNSPHHKQISLEIRSIIDAVNKAGYAHLLEATYEYE